jgi:hypothetical protein
MQNTNRTAVGHNDTTFNRRILRVDRQLWRERPIANRGTQQPLAPPAGTLNAVALKS